MMSSNAFRLAFRRTATGGRGFSSVALRAATKTDGADHKAWAAAAGIAAAVAVWSHREVSIESIESFL